MTFSKNIFRKTTIIPVLLAIGLMFTTPMLLDVAAAPGGNGKSSIPNNALVPDISPGIPKHLNIHNQQQSEEDNPPPNRTLNCPESCDVGQVLKSR